MSDLDRKIGRCYFCPSPSREPVVYVRWQGRRHYAFLCAEHEAEYAEHVAARYTLVQGTTRLHRLFAE